ncbi:Protein kinase C-like [Lachnellula willkommii]|uniref:protein kinase C n=1 Tax=Lachnellula willkommii TaxID=215461 RepID=A0A559MH35_9HELO|nr:Protein kinase C-like [Lachnellula willkommii]
MNNDDDALSSVYKKIERERALLNAANQMRQQTQNEQVRSRIDTQIREGRRNIQYLEERMQELQMRRMGQGMDNMNIGPARTQSSGLRNDRDGPPTPPPKDSRGAYMDAAPERGGYGTPEYSQVGGHGDIMPPRHPYAPPGPDQSMPRTRPNFTKLDLIKYDTPYLGPRIQLMLSQLEFKLNVEKQYLKGIEKMVQLYQMEGDRKSRADAAGRRVESNQKIQLLKQALKRYEDLHIDMESTADAPDDDSINMPNMRKPLTGLLSLRVHAVKDVDHATTGRFARGPETFVAVKVEDNVVARTRTSRTDRWDNEFHNLNVDKANEIELTVYDKPSDHPLPIGLLWIRISDIVEEMRRKKIEAEINSSGWVSADRMGSGSAPGAPPPSQFPSQSQFGGPPQSAGAGAAGNPVLGVGGSVVAPQPIDAWFALEPTETDPDEEKINHRIPHRFEKFSNMSANWCCHCGYILPFGKKNCRKCSGCVHLVPDFCGMSMAVANTILDGIRNQKRRQTAQPSMSGRTLRPQSQKPTSPQEQQGQFSDPRASYGSQEQVRPPRAQSYGPVSASSPEAAEAAKAMYAQQQVQTSPGRPPGPDRTSSASAAAAAAAAMSGTGSSSQRDPYNRSSTDYRPTATGYPPRLESHPEDGYGAPKPQVSSQSSYNPAAYAQVSGYPTQPLNQPQVQPVQQSPTAALYGPNSQVQQEPIPVAQPAAVIQRKAPPQVDEASKATPRIGLDHFNFLAVLGKGNFGKVMLAEAKQSKQLYAIKVLKKEFIIENDEVESTRSEKRVFLIANKERHPFLLTLHACFQTETRVYFVMEYISGGDLMLHIQRGQFGTKRAQFYAAEVCLALKYFHENGVIYRDLKLDNIMLTLDGHIKVADYGLCKEDMWYGSTTSTFCGTPEFMAPEILLDKKYGRAVDWWAFGVLIYQMLLQQSPFRGEDEDEIYDAILADEPLYPIHMPRDSVSILQKLLTREPEQRLGSGPTDAQEIMSQPFFRNINWDDVYHKRIQPPFQPVITSATDTSNFDTEFTSVTPVLTPVQSVLSQAMQEEFRGFSYSIDFV